MKLVWTEALEENHLAIDPQFLDACWGPRIARARDAFTKCIDHPSAFTSGAACPTSTATLATVDPWWNSATPCPGQSTLEVQAFPDAKTPLTARCVDEGVDRGRFTSWHPNSSVFVDGGYDADGRKDGDWRVFTVSGIPAAKRSFRHGEDTSEPVCRGECEHELPVR